MKNIFILYMPQGNAEAMVHYTDTIVNKVSQDRIFKFIDHNLQNRLRSIFNNKSIAVWGSRNSSRNRAHFEKMQPGDDVLIVEGNTIKLLGKISAKTINSDLSQELWKNIGGNSHDGWNLIYFIANPLEIDLPFDRFKQLFKYKPNWSLRGFTSISDDRLESFYAKYDELYAVLQRMKQGEKVVQKPEEVLVDSKPEIVEEEEKTEDTDVIRDHIRMQWKLTQLGLKSGSKVWVPKNDQKQIARHYQYSDYGDEFTSGIDVQAKYVENIDVIWKEEFRVDAAFEVENSTSIYSGLLRFSDLKIVAPNSNYPLFIVAPRARKNKVMEQVHRPSFKKMEFESKVRFLSYETVDEVDSFFTNSTSGLNVDMLYGKSEEL